MVRFFRPVPRDPRPAHFLWRSRAFKFDPQLAVEHWLTRTGTPAVDLPLRYELGHSPLQIFGVCKFCCVDAYVAAIISIVLFVLCGSEPVRTRSLVPCFII